VKHKQNPLHKHQLNVIKKLKMDLSTEGIITMKADKNKTMVVMDRKQCMNKVHKFLKDNVISNIEQNPTTKFHKKNPKNDKIMYRTN